MIYIKYKYRLVILCFFINLVGGYGQSSSLAEPTPAVSKSAFNDIIRDLDYSKKTKWELRLKPKYKKALEPEKKENKIPSSLGLGPILQYLAYLIIAVLIGAIIFLLLTNFNQDKKIEHAEIHASEIEDIDSVDTRAGYEAALQAGDYRSAIRMQFIYILKYLSESKKIDWQPEKTNRDYARELRSGNFYQDFKLLSHIYEWVWYGHTDLSKSVFTDVNRHFVSFITKTK